MDIKNHLFLDVRHGEINSSTGACLGVGCKYCPKVTISTLTREHG